MKALNEYRSNRNFCIIHVTDVVAIANHFGPNKICGIGRDDRLDAYTVRVVDGTSITDFYVKVDGLDRVDDHFLPPRVIHEQVGKGPQVCEVLKDLA